MEDLTPAEQYLAEKQKRIELYTKRWELAKDPLTGRDLSGPEYDWWLYYMDRDLYNERHEKHKHYKSSDFDEISGVFKNHKRRKVNKN